MGVVVHGALEAARERERQIAAKRMAVEDEQRRIAFTLWYGAKLFHHWSTNTVPVDARLRKAMMRDWPSIGMIYGDLQSKARQRARAWEQVPPNTKRQQARSAQIERIRSGARWRKQVGDRERAINQERARRLARQIGRAARKGR